MKTLIYRFICIAFICFLSSSCEDKELVKKNEELSLELSELEKKADLMEIDAGTDPGDQTAALEKVNAELINELAKLKSLDEEKQDIEKKQEELERELRAYQKQYKIQ